MAHEKRALHPLLPSLCTCAGTFKGICSFTPCENIAQPEGKHVFVPLLLPVQGAGARRRRNPAALQITSPHLLGAYEAPSRQGQAIWSPSHFPLLPRNTACSSLVCLASIWYARSSAGWESRLSHFLSYQLGAAFQMRVCLCKGSIWQNRDILPWPHEILGHPGYSLFPAQ